MIRHADAISAIILSGTFLNTSVDARDLYTFICALSDGNNISQGVAALRLSGADDDALKELENRGLIEILDDDFTVRIKMGVDA